MQSGKIFITRMIFCVVLLMVVNSQLKAQNNPSEVVASFGHALSSWCNTNQVSYRERIDQLCSGPKKCRVEDVIHTEYQKGRGLTNYETFVLDSYLNMFQSLIPRSLNYKMSNVKVVGSDEMPNGTLTFITADITLSGAINKSVTDLFLVRNNKISGIYTYTSIYGFKHLNHKLLESFQKNNYTANGFIFNNYIKVSKGPHSEGLINFNGEIVIPCIWDIVLDNGMFAMGGRKPSGLFVGPEWYWWNEHSRVYDLRTGLPTTIEGVHNEIDYSNYHDMMGRWQILKKIFNESYAVVYQEKNEKIKYGYLKEGDLSYNVKYIYDEASYFKNGLACVKIGNESMVINKNLEVVLKLNHNYDFCIEWSFDKDLIIIYDKNTLKSGVINLNGKWIIPCGKYNDIYPIYNGLAKVSNNDKYGFINSEGDLILPCIYEDAYRFINGICQVLRYEDYELIDQSGKNIVGNMKLAFREPNEDDDKLWNRNIIMIENSVGKWALINSRGKTYYGFNWEHDYLKYHNDNMIEFEKHGKRGFMNISGEVTIPPIYNSILGFKNGYCCVSKDVNGKQMYGCINMYGLLVVPCIYDCPFEISNGIAIVQKNDRAGIIDLFGNSYFWYND